MKTLLFLLAMAATASAQCVNGVCAIPATSYRMSMPMAVQPVTISRAIHLVPAAEHYYEQSYQVAYAPSEVYQSVATTTPVAGCPCVQADGVCACATPSVMRSAPASYRVVYHGTSNRPLMRAVRYGVARPVGRLVRAPFRLLGRCCR